MAVRKTGTKRLARNQAAPRTGRTSARRQTVALPLRIRDFMQKKPIYIGARASLDEAQALMEENGVRHLPVEEGHRLVGVVSDRDLANGRAQGFRGEAEVGSVMTLQPYCVEVDEEFSKVLEVMAANRLGCVLVRDHGENIVGIFTTTDAVRILSRVAVGQVKSS